MPTTYKLTTRKENEFRRQKAAFKKLTDEEQKRAFLATCEWWPMEFWRAGQKGLRWYPTAVGIIMLDDDTSFGFDTPEEAQLHGQAMRAEYAQPAIPSAL